MMLFFFFLFFFFSSRRRHTRLQGDWNSDVCSSDLLCCTRMSVRLFDIPHRKNSTITNANSAACPVGNTGTPLPAVPRPADVETCISTLLLRLWATWN